MHFATKTCFPEPAFLPPTGRFRGLCLQCRNPPLTCYCRHLRRLDPKIRFVILIHGREAQKRVATGRIAHLCLENSLLLQGYDYSDDTRVNALLNDSSLHPLVLYPGLGSTNLSEFGPSEKAELIPQGKELVVFVVDGTWITARKTMQRSRNLRKLPRICFTPGRPSRFRVRRQPQPHFFSTVEAIHETIELLGPSVGFATAGREHDRLLHVFDCMVERQIELSSQSPPRKRQ